MVAIDSTSVTLGSLKSNASRPELVHSTLRDKGNRAVAQLCPECALCCNGVLFGDVELQSKDDAEQLAASGLRIEQKGKKLRFLQPCSCLDGTLCGIYADRPMRCRTFECRLLQKVQRKALTVAAALKSIHEARQQVKTVRRLLKELGQNDDHLPLSRRYAKVVAEPIDLGGDERMIELRSELMLAVHKLTKILQRDFLT